MYWTGSGFHQKDYEALVSAYVPDAGPATTVQGELLRCATGLASEHYRNGNVNWVFNRGKFIALVDSIGGNLVRFESEGERREVRGYLDAIRGIGVGESDPQDFAVDPWDALIHSIVVWCIAHPEPTVL